MRDSLVAHNIQVLRGGVPALQNVTIEIQSGQITSVFGLNGAGKSSLVLALASALPLVKGKIFMGKMTISTLTPDAVRLAGVSTVPEGHIVFGELTVRDNLCAAATMLSKSLMNDSLAKVIDIFPELLVKLQQPAKNLSGGEKQMVRISQALMAPSKFILFDEMSFGLAPSVVKRLIHVVNNIANTGVGVLLTDQFAAHSLAISQQVYVLQRGRVVYEGVGGSHDQISNIYQSAYLASEHT